MWFSRIDYKYQILNLTATFSSLCYESNTILIWIHFAVNWGYIEVDDGRVLYEMYNKIF